MRHTVVRYLLISLVSLTCGCIGFSRKHSPVRKQYILEVHRSKHETAPLLEKSCLVKPLTISKSYGTNSFFYRVDTDEVRRDYYNEFATRPELQITEVLREWVSSAHIFETVLSGTSVLAPAYVIEGSIRELFGNFTTTDGKAILSIELKLIEHSAGGPEFLFGRDYERRIPVDVHSPNALIEAWNKGLLDIFTTFESDVRTFFREPLSQ